MLDGVKMWNLVINLHYMYDDFLEYLDLERERPVKTNIFHGLITGDTRILSERWSLNSGLK